jgi:hypothetical protein
MTVDSLLEEEDQEEGQRAGAPTVVRTRTALTTIFAQLGPTFFRRMYRMDEDSFFNLFHLLEPQMPQAKVRARGKTINGPVTNESRLAMALRYFAGGEKYDIAALHGVHFNEVYRSVWLVVDAIHASSALNIAFPTKHEEQLEMAKGFEKLSKCGFSNVVAVGDGMLVWTSKPTEKTDDLGVGPKKFFNGRKSKFGINMQAFCDHKRRFVDVYCSHPGATSDFTMWLECGLRRKVETQGFLGEDDNGEPLVLFGDNAYINTPYMVTPFKNVSSGPKFDFNFYHSQLRINIECAFGMLVHRFGCLRKPMPMNFAMTKICRLVVALCKIHNYCIDCRDHSMDKPLVASGEDFVHIGFSGGFPPARTPTGRINELMDAGHNRNRDEARDHARRVNGPMSRNDLPIYKLLRHTEQGGYKRPPVSVPK